MGKILVKDGMYANTKEVTYFTSKGTFYYLIRGNQLKRISASIGKSIFSPYGTSWKRDRAPISTNQVKLLKQADDKVYSWFRNNAQLNSVKLKRRITSV